MEKNHGGSRKAHVSKSARQEFNALCKRVAQLDPNDAKLLAFLWAFSLSAKEVKEGTFEEAYNRMADSQTNSPYSFITTHHYKKEDDTVSLVKAVVRCKKKTILLSKTIQYGQAETVTAIKVDAATKTPSSISIPTSNAEIAKALDATNLTSFELNGWMVYTDEEAAPNPKGYKFNGFPLFQDAIIFKVEEDGELQSVTEEEFLNQIS